MTKFKNMKIAITPEQPLNVVCRVLESMGYKKERWGNLRFPQSIRTWESGFYTDMRTKQIYDYGYIETTLADLIKMSAKNYFIPLSNIEPQQLYTSGLTSWGLDEIKGFKAEGYTYWSYPDDVFIGDTVILSSLENLKELKIEANT
ncbi:TPA: hypothetical protein ACIFEI_002076 [Acinetobacter nosocomialis]